MFLFLISFEWNPDVEDLVWIIIIVCIWKKPNVYFFWFFYLQIDFHFHYLEIQAIESKKPNQVGGFSRFFRLQNIVLVCVGFTLADSELKHWD